MNFEALQTKYPIIDWEVYTEDSRMYWKIIRVEPTEDKERELWVELKRLFEPDDDDILWKLQRHMHDPLKWRSLMTLMLSNKLQVDEYSVIVNGDAPVVASASAEGPIPPKTAKQKLARKNELKAKSTLLLAIPDEHLLNFMESRMQRPYGEASNTMFGWQHESKKIQEDPNSRQNNYDKIVRQQALIGLDYDRKDENLKLLRSLPSAWNNIALIMRNKSDLDTMSMDDLYSNLKVYEAEIKGQSATAQTLKMSALYFRKTMLVLMKQLILLMKFLLLVHRDKLLPQTMLMMSCFPSLLINLIVHNWKEDLEQIDTDDLEEMDLKWAGWPLLTHKGDEEILKKTGRNLNFNGKETVGFDKTNVECYNCHRRGHFARECRAPKNQGNINGDALRRIAEEGITNFALMAYTSQGSSSSSSSDSENLTKLINSQISAKDKVGLGYDSQMNKSEVVNSVFNSKESDVVDSTVNDKFKTGEGFHVVPPPYTGNYMPSRLDLSFTGLDDFVYKAKVSETITIASKTSKDSLEKPKTIRPSAPIIEDWDADSDNDSDQGIFNSGCSRNMTGNKSFLTDYLEMTGRFVAFARSPKKGKITRKGKIRTGKLDFEDVYFVKELKFNLFFCSQMCDKKNSVLFTKTECLVLSPDFKLLDENPLGKFDEKADEGFFVRYFINNKAFRVFNNRTRKNSKDAVADFASKKTMKNQQMRVKEMVKRKEELQIKKMTRMCKILELDWIICLFNRRKVSLVLSVEYDDEDVGAEADLNNLETTMNVSPIPTTRIHKDHLKDQIIGDINSATQTRKMTKISEEHVMQCKKSFCNLNFKRFGHLVDLPKGKRDIGTKWVYKNKKAEKGIVARNKARLVAQDLEFLDKVYNVEKDLYGLHQAPRAWYETLSTYLLKMDTEEMMHKRFQMSSIGELTFFLGLQIMQKDDGIFISQDKYVADILKKFDFVTVKTARTPIETNKALLKDEEA
ncbi:ribonuclease H-like domain-containing protein [Tanacetum coccineum]